jgi:branched-chain amino acid transport system permease protein
MTLPGGMKNFLFYAVAAIVLSAVAFMLGSYQTDVYRKLLLWVTLALGYNFLFGIAGQVTFSHFAFYGLGAYSAVIAVTQLHLPLALALVLTIAVCVAVALLVAIPSTRLEGFYLALATIALAQLFIVILNEGGEVTGGNGGLANYSLPEVFGMRLTGPPYTVVIVLLLLLTFAILRRLDRSWFGRACRAVRDNPEAAQAMGVNVRATKIIAFTVTSALAGLAGAVYAFVDNTVSPLVFGLDNCFLLLFMVIVGGAGRPAGAILGAVILYVMPFFLSPLIGHHHALVFGVFMVLAVMFQPRGLIGLFSRARGARGAR